MPGKHAAAGAVECIIPSLSVSSLAESVRYYAEVLGFQVDWRVDGSSSMASVSRDGKGIMLCEHEQGQPGTRVWIGVEDIEPLYRQYLAGGARFREHPTDYPWAYEMRVEDPDGHIPRFGSEPKRA